MWLTGRLAPDFKTIADFRKDNGPAIRDSCRRFVDLCRRLELFSHALDPKQSQVGRGDQVARALFSTWAFRRERSSADYPRQGNDYPDERCGQGQQRHEGWVGYGAPGVMRRDSHVAVVVSANDGHVRRWAGAPIHATTAFGHDAND
jgi:hypothetical protein